MKRTLFLAMSLGVVASGLSMADTAYYVGPGPVPSGKTAWTEGTTLRADHLWFDYSDGNIEISQNMTVETGNGGLWVGPVAASKDGKMVISGNVSGSGKIVLNTWSTDDKADIFEFTGENNTFDGIIAIERAGNARAWGQLNLSGETISSAIIGQYNGSSSILNVTGSATIKGIQTSSTFRVTSTNASNVLTLDVDENKTLSSGATIGNVANNTYFETYGTADTVASKALSIVKKGAGTQIVTGGVKLSSIDVQQGQFSLSKQQGDATNPSSIAVDTVTVAQGATFGIGYNEGTITSVTLNGGKLFHYDMLGTSMAEHHTTIETLNVAQASTFEAKYKGVLDITTLSGSANLALSKTQGGTDVMTINIGSITDYQGTISAPSSNADKLLLNLSGANQSSGKTATLSHTVSLQNGFTKIGAGTLALGATNLAGDATISEGSVTAGTLKLMGHKITLNGGSLTHDSVTYSAIAGTTDSSITRTGDGAMSLFSDGSATTLKNVVLTTSEDKAYSATMNNVSLVSNANKSIWLKGANIAKDLVNVSTGGTLYIGAGTYSDRGKDEAVNASISGTANVHHVEGGINAKLTLSGAITTTNDSSVTNLTLSGGTFTVKQDHTGTLTVTNLTVDELGSVVNANLVIAENGSLDFSTGNILTMGCDVTINGVAVVTVSTAAYENLLADSEANAITLFENVANFNSTGAVWVTDGTAENLGLFSYNVEDGTVRIVPEPATATLSLLALAGLCARRRRH